MNDELVVPLSTLFEREVRQRVSTDPELAAALRAKASAIVLVDAFDFDRELALEERIERGLDVALARVPTSIAFPLFLVEGSASDFRERFLPRRSEGAPQVRFGPVRPARGALLAVIAVGEGGALIIGADGRFKTDERLRSLAMQLLA